MGDEHERRETTQTAAVPFSVAPKAPVIGEHTFRCQRDHNVAGSVRTHKRADGLAVVIDSFVGEQVHHVSDSMGDAVTGNLKRGDAKPLYELDPEYAPFYCPICDQVFCGECWRNWSVFADDQPGWFEETRGVCPNGHERRLVD